MVRFALPLLCVYDAEAAGFSSEGHLRAVVERGGEPKGQGLERDGLTCKLASSPLDSRIHLCLLDCQVDPAKRHIDKSVVAEFWRVLENWIGANKPWLHS